MDAKKYLADNPKCDVIHSTTDGNLFYVKGDAVNHAKTLKDATVTTFERTEKVASDDNTNDGKTAAVPYAKRNNDLLKAELVSRGIEFNEAGVKADFIALLEADDTKA